MLIFPRAHIYVKFCFVLILKVCNSYEICKDNCNFEFIIYNRRRMLVSRTDLSTGSEGERPGCG